MWLNVLIKTLWISHRLVGGSRDSYRPIRIYTSELIFLRYSYCRPSRMRFCKLCIKMSTPADVRHGFNIRWPTSDNLRPIKSHHNHSTTTPQRLHNHTTTTPQPLHNSFFSCGVVVESHDNHSTTTPQLCFSCEVVVESHHNHSTTTPQPLHNHSTPEMGVIKFVVFEIFYVK